MKPKNTTKTSVKVLLLAQMHAQEKRAALRVITPSEIEKLTFTIVGESLHIHGPHEVLERLARRLKRLGAKRGSNPYEI